MINKRNAILYGLFLLPAALPAQRLYVDDNTSLVMSGASKLVLNNTAFTCNGSFAPDTGTVLFTGDSTTPAYINGSTGNFYNVVINKPSGSVSLMNSGYIRGTLTMKNGNLHVGANVFLMLGNTGTIAGEKERSRLLGPGYITAIAPLNAPTQANPGNLGLSITSNANLGATTVIRKHTPVTLPNIVQSINRVYSVYSNGDSTNTAAWYTIGFHYLDAELNGVTETSVNLWNSKSNTWTYRGRISLDTGANLLTGAGTNLGSFTLGYSMDEARRPGDEEPKNAKSGDEEPKFVNTSGVVVFPNPVHDRCTMAITAGSDVADVISLYNASGNVLQQKHVQLHSGSNSIDWDLSLFAAGTYYLRSENNTFKSITITRL